MFEKTATLTFLLRHVAGKLTQRPETNHYIDSLCSWKSKNETAKRVFCETIFFLLEKQQPHAHKTKQVYAINDTRVRERFKFLNMIFDVYLCIKCNKEINCHHTEPVTPQANYKECFSRTQNKSSNHDSLFADCDLNSFVKSVKYSSSETVRLHLPSHVLFWKYKVCPVSSSVDNSNISFSYPRLMSICQIGACASA